MLKNKKADKKAEEYRLKTEALYAADISKSVSIRQTHLMMVYGF